MYGHFVHLLWYEELQGSKEGGSAVEGAEARSATMADSKKKCDFGHARGDIAEQVVGFR